MPEARWMALGCLVLACFSIIAIAEDSDPNEPAPEPGQLDVTAMTAVELDGRPADGPEPVAYQWRILEGEGGKLFSTDQQDAVFLAPNVERGVEKFVIELIVTYRDQPPSIRRLRVRVVPTDPEAALDDEGQDDTQWLTDHYKRAREAEEKKEKQSVPLIINGGSSSSSVTIGVAGGSGGYRRGHIGFRYQMSYPISQPVDVPPPGQTRLPGEGTWAPARPVPRGDLRTTFPPEIVERYESTAEPEPTEQAPAPEATPEDR